jgi:hypothetical protein
MTSTVEKTPTGDPILRVPVELPAGGATVAGGFSATEHAGTKRQRSKYSMERDEAGVAESDAETVGSEIKKTAKAAKRAVIKGAKKTGQKVKADAKQLAGAAESKVKAKRKSE